MYHYNFTNELRITFLDEILREASNAFLTDTIPSAAEDKSKNNNYMTVGFYFNLKAKGNCAKLAAKGNTKKVVLNFIKKFQFPNPRTPADYENSIHDGILLAPMRDIVKILHILSLNDISIAYLTKEEIKNFIFYNDDLAKRNNYNLLITASQIIQYRKNSILPKNVDTKESEHIWNQPERQIREMIKTLNYTGCFMEDENGIRLKTDGITRDNEADLFEIINCNSYWNGETTEDYQKYMDEISIMKDNLEKQDIKQKGKHPTQTIYYGVPGSGKSHKIDEKTKGLPDEQKIRVVFHPEYTNADFVGQILPKVKNGSVEYEFKPGPFTKILYRAYHNYNTPYCLIIEEINRGNAAAIFGDVFQLLDRIKKGDAPENINGNTFGEGWSKYFVENEFINNYLRSPVEYSKEGFTENHDKKSVTFKSGITFCENTGIRLPPNLSIYATMNTSDQNVFTLDNAFQRRWEMELVQNVVDKKDENGIKQMNAKITVNNQSITWEDFQTQINSIIGDKSNDGLSSMEDKRLGCWFIKAENGVINEKHFANKVLKYLWDDAFKFCHQEIFESDIKNFEELQNRFLETGFDIFSENCGLKNYLSNNQSDSQSQSNPVNPQDSEPSEENSEQ